MKPAAEKGLTLLELLVTIAVLAVVGFLHRFEVF